MEKELSVRLFLKVAKAKTNGLFFPKRWKLNQGQYCEPSEPVAYRPIQLSGLVCSNKTWSP